MKKPEVLLKEYVGKLSEENLVFLQSRFEQRLQGDLAECLVLLAKTTEIDKFLNTAKSSDEFYEFIDLVAEYVKKEFKKRNLKREE
jgi:hypothetical protein